MGTFFLWSPLIASLRISCVGNSVGTVVGGRREGVVQEEERGRRHLRREGVPQETRGGGVIRFVSADAGSVRQSRFERTRVVQ